MVIRLLGGPIWVVNLVTSVAGAAGAAVDVGAEQMAPGGYDRDAY